MVTIYQYMPAWTVPCISPYVTKVIFYMTMVGIPFETLRQDLTRLDRDTPAGKLPVIDDGGTRVCDSTAIIRHFQATRGDTLDADAGSAERGVMAAFNRLIDEHLYWTAVIQPRWRESAGWERYLRIIAGTDNVPPDLHAFADDFRFRVLNAFMNGGWGRLPAEKIYARAREDIDAIAGWLGNKPFFMGDRPRSIDAAVLSILRHIVDAPFDFDTRHYAARNHALLGYMERMKTRFGI